MKRKWLACLLALGAIFWGTARSAPPAPRATAGKASPPRPPAASAAAARKPASDATPAPAPSRSLGVVRRIPIKEVHGKVLSWDPWASSWEDVAAGTPMWESSLIQVTENASVTFEMRASEGFTGLQSDVVEVTINHPSVFRLDAHVLRKVNLSTFFIPQLPEITQAKGAKGSLLYEKFGEAWQRFAALVMPGSVKASWFRDLSAADDQDATVAAKARQIRIFTPTKDMLIVPDRLPTELTILWHKVPEPNQTYEIMIWKIDEPRRPPIAVTRFDYYYARLFHDGDFYVQVATADGRWQSQVRQIHVMLPMQGRIAHTTAAQMGTDPLPLQLPPDQFQYIAREFPTEFSFSWERGTLGMTASYQFVLTDSANKELVRRVTNERLIRLKISKPGDYHWQVEGFSQATDRATVGTRVYSEIRSFRLKSAADLVAQPIANLFEQMIASGKSVVIYDEGGL